MLLSAALLEDVAVLFAAGALLADVSATVSSLFSTVSVDAGVFWAESEVSSFVDSVAAFCAASWVFVSSLEEATAVSVASVFGSAVTSGAGSCAVSFVCAAGSAAAS